MSISEPARSGKRGGRRLVPPGTALPRRAGLR
jgi:hypothetical protein